MVEFSIYSSSPRFLSCDLDRISSGSIPKYVVAGFFVASSGASRRYPPQCRAGPRYTWAQSGPQGLYATFFAGRKSDPDIVEWRENRITGWRRIIGMLIGHACLACGPSSGRDCACVLNGSANCAR